MSSNLVHCIAAAEEAVLQARQQQDTDDEDSQEPTRQSPWELFEEGLDSQQAAAEGPALEDALAERLKQATQTLAASQQFEVFADLLSPNKSYPAEDTGRCCSYVPADFFVVWLLMLICLALYATPGKFMLKFALFCMSLSMTFSRHGLYRM